MLKHQKRIYHKGHEELSAEKPQPKSRSLTEAQRSRRRAKSMGIKQKRFYHEGHEGHEEKRLNSLTTRSL